MSTYSFLYSAYNVACEILTGFTYCGLGKRLRKTGSTDTTSYVYDGMYAVYEFDGSERLKASYVYANGLLLGKREVTPGGIVTHCYHHDALGSTIGLTSGAGNVAQAYLYDESGNLIESWGNVTNHYLYTGQEWDSEIAGTELYNLRARYYDTGLGRFISEDPMLQAGYAEGWEGGGCPRCGIMASNVSLPFSDDPQNLNAYPYVVNNPVNLTDPVGLQGREGCTAAIAQEEMRRIREAYRQCFREMPYTWGPLEAMRWWGSGGSRGAACVDFVDWMIDCLNRKVPTRCCTVTFVCQVIHATLRIDCYTECERPVEKRRGDPYWRPPFAWW